MHGIVATLKIKDGVQAEFEAVANGLVEQSRQEPGCRGYTLWRTANANTYVFVEYYDNAEAIDAHMKSDHYRQIGRQLGAFLDGAPELKRLVGATS